MKKKLNVILNWLVTSLFYAKSNLVYFMDVFKKFCKDNDYDWNAVELLGILQYFNICTLYDNFKDGRYGNFLFLYGKYLLSKFLLRSEKWIRKN